jgi:hypothetical protein
VAPGTTAAEGSVTAPLMEPELDCAWSIQNMGENANTNRNEKMLRIGVRIDCLLRFTDF